VLLSHRVCHHLKKRAKTEKSTVYKSWWGAKKSSRGLGARVVIVLFFVVIIFSFALKLGRPLTHGFKNELF
jgi:hypothetical protein